MRKLSSLGSRVGAQAQRKNTRPPIGPAKVGDKRKWMANDDTLTGALPIYFKKYRLRARSEHAEIWTAAGNDGIATGLGFPEGDCRNDDPSRIRITKKQVNYFLKQFETNMWPKETKWFSHPPKRNGDGALYAVAHQLFGVRLPRDNFEGSGKRIVILIDNVRDTNFYDTDNANTLSRTAGFFWSTFNEIADRNIMSIDSFNWLARTGANPPHSPSTDPCLNYPAAPFDYEAVFSHEFQHLLEYYADPDGESLWVDEGTADWAQTLTHYVTPSAPITDVHYDSHIQCFLGYLEMVTDFNPIAAENCGAEQSLNLWGDQTDNEVEILADYGAAYTMMEMLVDRYGKDAMTFLHRDDANGFESLTKLLAREASPDSAADTIHDWLLMTAVDKLLDGGATLTGSTDDLEVGTLNAQVDWANDDSYSSPGAPPNGGDFVLARHNNGSQLGAADISSISFDGGDTLEPENVAWEVDADEHDGDSALYSGDGDEIDNTIAREVTVPATGATLTFDTKYGIEEGWDFGFVQVSTDGGETWTSLSNADTTSEHDPQAFSPITDQVPGFTGYSGGGAAPAWVPESFDLSAYAGQTVLLGFRYMTDQVFTEPGWWIDNVAVGTTTVSNGASLAGWETYSQINPIDVAGFTVQLVSWDNAGTNVRVGKLVLGPGFVGSLEGAALDAVIGTTNENVGMIVTFDEPTEDITNYANYELNVGNFTQDGGS
ncbi:MAG: hypothetical protein QOG04_1081 [Actinomycetota bacterium]|nr:hypothetical protein [Actinomycetota bacterium]